VGTVYYAAAADPRDPGGTMSPAAHAYSAPFVPNDNPTVRARVLADGEWSAVAELPPLEPDCQDDLDCDDGSACNGDELCEAGSCIVGAGTSPCSAGTVCLDDGDGGFLCVPCARGDCNKNGRLDAGDAICSVWCLIGTEFAGSDCSCGADCNCSGSIDAADPICTVRRMIGTFDPDTCVDP
jgi:hypothetical protein